MSGWDWIVAGAIGWIVLTPWAAFILARLHTSGPVCEDGSSAAREEETVAAVLALLWPVVLALSAAYMLVAAIMWPVRAAARVGARPRRGTPS